MRAWLRLCAGGAYALAACLFAKQIRQAARAFAPKGQYARGAAVGMPIRRAARLCSRFAASIRRAFFVQTADSNPTTISKFVR